MLGRVLIPLCILIGVSVITSVSFAISRIGNARISDSSLGFELPIPSHFGAVNEISQSGVRLTSPVPVTRFTTWSVFDIGSFETIDVYPVSAEYKNLPSGDLQTTENYFTGLGKAWGKLATTNSCLLVMRAETSDSTTVVALWGPKKGIVVIANNSSASQAAITSMLQGLRLFTGACEWK